MAVSKRLRFEVLRRDNHSCRYCGRSAPEVALTVDHVVPKALGGSDDPSNLVAACRDCNGGKSSVPADAPLIEDVAADAVRWARAIRQAAVEAAQQSAERSDLMGWFNMIWCDWTDWTGNVYDTPDGAFLSIPQFISAGVTKADLQELVTVAMNSRATDKWRYFCGCCWKLIKSLQERASEIVSQSDAVEYAPLLTTIWTDADLQDYQRAAETYVKDVCGEDVFDRIPQPPCSHGVPRHCGDPVCAVEDAHALTWLAKTIENQRTRYSLRVEAIAEEAEALIDG